MSIYKWQDQYPRLNFVFISVIHAVAALLITKATSTIQPTLGINIPVLAALLIGFGSVALMSGLASYAKKSDWLGYGIAIPYMYAWIGLFVGNHLLLTYAMRVSSIGILIFAPLPTVMFGIIGAYIGKSQAR